MFLPPPHADTQYIDERNGLVFPWFTKPFLDLLKTWDLKDKRVFEYGGGHSTIWWGEYAKEVYTVEADVEWSLNIQAEWMTRRMQNICLMPRAVVPGEIELKSSYVNAISEVPGEFDIIVIDGSYRDECIAAALTKIKDGGIIICDNWDQEGVWDSIMGSRLLDPWPMHSFIEPSRAGEARPWKTCYWQIFKPAQSFFCVNDAYNSHRPMLWMALEHIKPGLVLEFGAGYGSTPLLERYCKLQDRSFLSFESNYEWAAKFPGLTAYIQNYTDISIDRVNSYGEETKIIFIDSAPGEERAVLLKQHADKATVLIVHDTEPEAEHVYHLQEALNSFKYRCDLTIEGYPQTTAVSNVYDFERWKGVTLGKFRFV